MKRIFVPALCAAVLTLSACGGQGDDSLGDNVSDAADARADNLEEMADNATGAEAERLEQRADAVEEQGEAMEERIDEADVNAEGMTTAQ